MEEREVLKLSGLYQKTSEHAALELETVVLNINIGYNRELMERCKELHDYAEFVGRVRENLKSNNPLLHAVNEAVEYCIRNDILAEFLKKNRSEVIKMSIYEYDAEKHRDNSGSSGNRWDWRKAARKAAQKVVQKVVQKVARQALKSPPIFCS